MVAVTEYKWVFWNGTDVVDVLVDQWDKRMVYQMGSQMAVRMVQIWVRVLILLRAVY